MIRAMGNEDIGIIYNYLADEYASINNGKDLVTTLKFIIKESKNKYVLETDDGIIIGYYVWKETSPNTAELSSVFIAPKYRHTKYAKELWVHGANQLHTYKLVKCYMSYDEQQMPSKYYNKYRKAFDMKKLYEKVK